MISPLRILKALADENRLRLLLLLRERELFVCQLMAVTGLSQPLVSRSLALLEREGLLESRRQGKHVFYRLKPALPPLAGAVLAALGRGREPGGPPPRGRRSFDPGSPPRGRRSFDPGSSFERDRASLELFRRRFGGGAACDMSTVRDFIAFKVKHDTRSS